ncbi:LysR family transcriptional regulator [Tolumonas osonensis]|uniref:DNA-binding transcriptional LysR family regulator n=1 Tax=Tolumonas osonensis TaxID=675874 RepID=A0A841GH37_9GAMM|nr:LysR family transcriptional regulator [Tolumonas osonensis]MBB6054665.1 DNA-binding transcriptional LysR family regulator [Tolumonas osonensis]
MKLQLLYEFVTLCEMLNFTKAAQRMNITQPVLSRHMKTLEEHFGAELFKRDTHVVDLTSSGHLLLDEARKIILQYENSLDVMSKFTGKSKKKLKIAFLGEAVQQVLVDFLAEFNVDFPEVVIDCRDSELDEALSYLEDLSYDFGFLIRPNFVENELFEDLYIQSDTIGVAVNKRHPLAQQKVVSLNEVENWPIIRVDPGSFVLSHQFSTEFLDRYQIPYRVEKEYPNLKTCCFNLEFNHRAVLLMPRHRSYLLSENCVLLDIKEDKYWFDLELVWDAKNRNPCVPLFLRQFRKFLQHRNANYAVSFKSKDSITSTLDYA